MRPASTSCDQSRLSTCGNDQNRPSCHSFTPRRSSGPQDSLLCRPSSQASLPYAGTGYGRTGAVCPSWAGSRPAVLVAVADLHAICTRPASLLHTRELRFYDKGHGSQGESAAAGGVAWLRRAGAFLLKSNPPERYPSRLVASAEVTWAGPRPLPNGSKGLAR